MNTTWKDISEILRNSLESGVFRIWVAPLDAQISDCEINVIAPNAFMAEWAKRHLTDKILAAASTLLKRAESDLKLSFQAKSGQSQARIPLPVDSMLQKPIVQAELPLKTSFSTATPEWRYCFEDFVTGRSNNLAVAAARDMCASGQVRTLFVTSAPGMGKTHLAQAAGQLISRAGSALKVAYLTAEQFASRYVAAMRAKDLETYKQYLCGLDVLLLEDVHFLQRKCAMQEFLLNVIKNLQAKNARVIVTSSFSPKKFEEMDSSLTSYFCSGIIANMEKPDAEMRCEILRRKAKSFQVNLPDEICEMVSSRLSSDIRQLESCLKNMIFKARVLNSGITLDLALETMNQYSETDKTLSLSAIIRLVCESFGLTETQLRSRSRKHEYVQGRQTIFFLARKHTDMSLENIGSVLNRRHSTVLRSITQLEQELARESREGMQIARAMALIEKKCGL